MGKKKDKEEKKIDKEKDRSQGDGAGEHKKNKSSSKKHHKHEQQGEVPQEEQQQQQPQKEEPLLPPQPTQQQQQQHQHAAPPQYPSVSSPQQKPPNAAADESADNTSATKREFASYFLNAGGGGNQTAQSSTFDQQLQQQQQQQFSMIDHSDIDALEEMRHTLIQFFICYAPDRLMEIPKLLVKYRDSETTLKLQLRREFNQVPVEKEASLCMKLDPHTRLTAFYAHYNPSRIASVPQLLGKYWGKEKELWVELEKKYGPEQPLHMLFSSWEKDLLMEERRQHETLARGMPSGSPTSPSSPSRAFLFPTAATEREDEALKASSPQDEGEKLEDPVVVLDEAASSVKQSRLQSAALPLPLRERHETEFRSGLSVDPSTNFHQYSPRHPSDHHTSFEDSMQQQQPTEAEEETRMLQVLRRMGVREERHPRWTNGEQQQQQQNNSNNSYGSEEHSFANSLEQDLFAFRSGNQTQQPPTTSSSSSLAAHMTKEDLARL